MHTYPLPFNRLPKRHSLIVDTPSLGTVVFQYEISFTLPRRSFADFDKLVCTWYGISDLYLLVSFAID